MKPRGKSEGLKHLCGAGRLLPALCQIVMYQGRSEKVDDASPGQELRDE